MTDEREKIITAAIQKELPDAYGFVMLIIPLTTLKGETPVRLVTNLDYGPIPRMLRSTADKVEKAEADKPQP